MSVITAIVGSTTVISIVLYLGFMAIREGLDNLCKIIEEQEEKPSGCNCG